MGENTWREEEGRPGRRNEENTKRNVADISLVIEHQRHFPVKEKKSRHSLQYIIGTGTLSN